MEEPQSTMCESTALEVASEHTIHLDLQRGGTLSRYLLIERVGAGGMGVVWSAYDPELDRKVAIKLLRPRRVDGPSQEARTRLVREAQAMARLSHPNVIAVHDVGEHAGQVFVAMEFVEHGTLGTWAKQERRSWGEIVEMYVQAGRGLAEAHRAGLVHRDFKPDNVLVGDGRARVTDFGLARSVEIDTLDGLEPGPERADSSRPGAKLGLESTPALSTPLTRTGVMLGTPAYMAPEQFASGQFDARSDQFAFCVALWEALYGRRPFEGRTIVELADVVGSGRIEPPSGELRVPQVIERALRRGLSVEPGDRWPSIDALLTELQRNPKLQRRRWLVAGGLVASCAGALVVATLLSEPLAVAEVCPDPSVHLRGVWDSPRRAALESTLMTSGVDEPGLAWRQLAASVDDYTADWLAMHHAACEATHVRHEQSTELLDLRMQCLDRARVELAAKLDLLAGGEPRVIGSAPDLLARLPMVEACGRRAYLETSTPIPDDEQLAAKVEAVREQLAASKARVEAGLATEEIPALRALLATAEATGYSPLQAEVLAELGFASGGDSSETADATRELLERAVNESMRAGLDDNAARAALELAYVIGVRLGHHDEALRWVGRIDAWNDRLDAPAYVRAQQQLTEGLVRVSKGDEPERAAELLFESLSLLGVDASLRGLEGLKTSHAVVATWALSGLSMLAYAQGDYQRAHAVFLALAKVRTRLYGATHRFALHSELQLAELELELGDWDARRATIERVGATIKSRPEQQPHLHATLLISLVKGDLAVAELGEDQASRARAAEPLEPLFDEAQAALEVVWGAESPATLEVLTIGARLDRIAGRLDEAAAKLERARSSLEGLMPPAKSQAELLLLLELGRLGIARGELEAANQQLERAIALANESSRPVQPLLAEALTSLAQAQHGLGQSEQAKSSLERAIVVWDQLRAEGHPRAIVTLELLAGIDAARGEELRARAASLRAGLW